MILLSHPIGNEFVREALVAFDQAGMLEEFWTAINWNPKSAINRALPRSLRELFASAFFSRLRSIAHAYVARSRSVAFARRRSGSFVSARNRRAQY